MSSRNQVDWWRQGRCLTPSMTRMGDNFLLSDFMFNDSVIRKGDANQMPNPAQNRTLEEHVIQMSIFANRVYDIMGPCSIGYGYITREQSVRRVKYQDGNKPSYHRWDDGCAADFVFHHWKTIAPILQSLPILEGVDISRLITYSESPYICLGTGLGEKENRGAVYYNMWRGEHAAAPLHITMPKRIFQRLSDLENSDSYLGDNWDRWSELRAMVEVHGWEGQGWPSYHLHGQKQIQHIRLGSYIMLSDILKYQPNIDAGCQVHFGEDFSSNRPPPAQEDIDILKRKVDIMDRIFMRYYLSMPGILDHALPPRISIISAYGGTAIPVHSYVGMQSDDMMNWEGDNFEWILSIPCQDEAKEFLNQALTSQFSVGVRWEAFDIEGISTLYHVWYEGP